MAVMKSNPLEEHWKAVERVQERMRRAVAALNSAAVEHCLLGGNAVAWWVATVDPAAVRTTRNVDLLIRREDFPRIQSAMEAAGFHYRHVAGVDMFLDGDSAREAVHLIWAGEKVRDDHPITAPDPSSTTIQADGLRPLGLLELVTMKLTSFRRKDQVHLLDLISVGLVNEGTLEQVPECVRTRLSELLADPDG